MIKKLLRKSENLYSLDEWIDWLTYVLAHLLTIILPITFILTFPQFIARGSYFLILLDLVLLVLVLMRAFIPNTTKYFGNIIWVFILYVLTISFFVELGPNYARSAWMMLCAVIAAIIYGVRGAMFSSILNIIILLALFYLGDATSAEWSQARSEGLGHWLRFVANMTVLCLSASISVGFLMSRLNRSLHEERLSKEEVKKSEKRYRLIAENTADLISIIDIHLHFTYVSPATMRLRGFTVEEAMEQTLEQILTPESLRIGLAVFEEEMQMEASGTVDPDRIRILKLEEYKKDGSTIWVEVTLSFLRDKDGKPTEILMVTRDIAERKQAEDELRKSEEKYRSIVETTAEWIWEMDITGKHTFSNRGITAILGYSLEEFIGQNAISSLHAEDRIEVEKKLPLLMAEKRGWNGWVLRWQHKNGTYRYLESNATPITNEAGDFIGYLGADRDITARKQAEDHLALSEQQTRAILQASPVAIGRIRGRRVEWANEMMSQITGYSLEEYRNQDTRYLYENDAEHERVGEILYTEGTVETRWVRKDGNIQDISIQITQTSSDAYIFSVIDLTEHKQAEKALSESEDKFRNLAEKSMVGIYMYQDGLFRYVNNEFGDIFGYRPEEVINRLSLEDVIFPEDLATVLENVGRRLEGDDKSKRYDFRAWSKDGKLRQVEVYGSQTIYQGRTAIIGTVLDITERRKTEDELRRLSIAIEQAAEDIIITNAEGVIEYVNPAFEKITGYSRLEAIGNTPRILKSGFHDSAFYGHLWNTIKSGEIWSGRITNRCKNGMIIQEDATISPLCSSTGKLTGYVALKRDVTETVKLEDQLRQSQKMEAMGQLAGGIAHDFNNILGSISGYTQMALENVPKDSKASEHLKRIFKSSRRAVDLVSQILTFSRRKDKELKPLMLRPLIKEALKLISSTIPATIAIRQNIKAEPDIVMADVTYIHQVIMNLCANASFAMQKNGGVLSVGLVNETILPVDVQHPGVTPGHYLKLTISDTGEGMAPEVIERIFDPFFTTKKQGEGTGMGLSVVHGIVKNLGGEITVDSHLGQGTSFTILLPLLENVLPENIPEQEVAESIEGSGKILFVDDEEDLVVMATEMLESLGYEVTATQSSVEALEMFRANPDSFDLVMTDQTMPKISGMAMAQEMMRIRPDTPIILCTGFSSTVNAEEVKVAGIRKFILKPMIKNEIAASIHEILKTSPLTGDISIPDAPYEQFTGVRALVADDQDFNQELITELLLQVGIEADIAINGREAVKMVRARDYDIVLMDILMPVMDGLEAAREIRNLEGKGIEILPILALSGHAALSDRKKSLAAGMNDHLTKPIDAILLHRALRQWLPQEKYAAVAEDDPDTVPIPLVPGLDVEAALKRLRGNRHLYRKLLDSYIPGYGETSAMLLQEVQAGKWEDALRRVHSIKGVAGTLGSTILADAARKLEKTFRTERSCESAVLRKPLQAFIDCHEDLIAAIGAVLPRQSGDAPAKPEGQPWAAAEMGLLLMRLKIALGSEEPLPCKEIMAELLQRPCPEARDGVIEELNRLISGYRLPEALALLEKEFNDVIGKNGGKK